MRLVFRLLIAIIIAVPLLSACSNRAGRSEGSAATGSDSYESQDEPAVSDQPIHESYSLTTSQLEELVADLGPEVRARISARPDRFLDLLLEIRSQPEELLWQVDRRHPAPDRYEPSDLVSLDDYSDRLDLSREGHRLREIVLPDLFAMVGDARAEGVTLLISSVYRSHDYQAGIYDYWVETVGQEEADRISALPGTSQHQLGTTIDFGCICDEFADTSAGRWLAENAFRYGFSLSYPEGYEDLTGYAYESWHYRYIGRAAARLEQEYFGGIQYDLLAFSRTHMRDFLSFLMVN